MGYPLGACALHYLDQWFLTDRDLHSALNGSDKNAKLEALSKAGKFYGVAINFPRKYDEGLGLWRYEPVLEVLDGPLATRCTSEQVKARVSEVAADISARYGGRGMTSATSKFLWLKHRAPFVFYDYRVRNALGVKHESYPELFDQWQIAYDRKHPKIQTTCEMLPDVLDFAFCGRKVGIEDVRETVQREWFQQRVFDIYLWFKGV